MATAESAGTDRPRWFFSRLYASVSPRLDQEGMAELRTELLGPLSGEIVEIGAGNGRNFGRYPVAVASVTAIEPEPHLRALAVQSAADAPVSVSVRPGLAERLPLPDGSVTGWCCVW